MVKVETWLVTWVTQDKLDEPHITKCAVREGYSTLADIPKMLGIKRGIKPEEIQLTKLELAGVEYR